MRLLMRFLLIAACSISGFFISYINFDKSIPFSFIGLLLGLLIALTVIQIEQVIRKASLRIILGGVIGTIIGLLIALLLSYGLRFITNIEKQEIALWIFILLTCILGYLGLVIGTKKSEEVSFPFLGALKGVRSADVRILDTSVIIDGRIADICETGFIEGNLTVPRFVLDELQHIADSSDSMKRSRGRRGLDILNRMQKTIGINIEIVDQDFPKVKGVDGKLVAMARKMNGKLITNDFNLNKVAELQGIKILNVNELANALKPVVLPGETMVVKIIKEGKEPGQGVAYLDDGTMVVIDHGSRNLGDTVEVAVTSVLQTTAGRMIFSEMKAVVPEKRMQGLNTL
jgi:uncharacterized protein YacL